MTPINLGSGKSTRWQSLLTHLCLFVEGSLCQCEGRDVLLTTALSEVHVGSCRKLLLPQAHD